MWATQGYCYTTGLVRGRFRDTTTPEEGDVQGAVLFKYSGRGEHIDLGFFPLPSNHCSTEGF